MPEGEGVRRVDIQPPTPTDNPVSPFVSTETGLLSHFVGLPSYESRVSSRLRYVGCFSRLSMPNSIKIDLSASRHIRKACIVFLWRWRRCNFVGFRQVFNASSHVWGGRVSVVCSFLCDVCSWLALSCCETVLVSRYHEKISSTKGFRDSWTDKKQS
jgi:hypothetical protein